MRWWIVCALLLTGCAGSGSLFDAVRPAATQDAPGVQLQQAVQALVEAENRQQLDAFIDVHTNDVWGDFAVRFRALHTEARQLDKRNQVLTADTRTLSRQNQDLQQQLQKLKSKLEELTRSLIEQERRQP